MGKIFSLRTRVKPLQVTMIKSFMIKDMLQIASSYAFLRPNFTVSRSTSSSALNNASFHQKQREIEELVWYLVTIIFTMKELLIKILRSIQLLWFQLKTQLHLVFTA